MYPNSSQTDKSLSRKVIRMTALPEVRGVCGKPRVIDATVRPRARRTTCQPVVQPTVQPTVQPIQSTSRTNYEPFRSVLPSMTERLPTPTPPPRPTPNSQDLVENVKRLEQQVRLITEQMDSLFKLFREQSVSSSPSISRQVIHNVCETHDEEPDDPLEVSFASREYLSRNKILEW